jgi:hypothetical protein
MTITYTLNRYKISLYATDGTCELEFVLFDERATSLIGKTAEKLLRHNNKSELPEEIKAIVGEKLTVVAKLFPGKVLKRQDLTRTTKIQHLIFLVSKRGMEKTYSFRCSKKKSLLFPTAPAHLNFQSYHP